MSDFIKKTWANGDVITAAELNRMEDGIDNSTTKYNELKTQSDENSDLIKEYLVSDNIIYSQPEFVIGEAGDTNQKATFFTVDGPFTAGDVYTFVCDDIENAVASTILQANSMSDSDIIMKIDATTDPNDNDLSVTVTQQQIDNGLDRIVFSVNASDATPLEDSCVVTNPMIVKGDEFALQYTDEFEGAVSDIVDDTVGDTVSNITETINDLSYDVSDKAQVIINTGFGSITSFTDGGDGLPMKSLKIGIEPVQDLHGYDRYWYYDNPQQDLYDYPWPGGGGVNKILPYDSDYTDTPMTGFTVTYSVETETFTLSGTNPHNDLDAVVFTGRPGQGLKLSANLNAGDRYYFGAILPTGTLVHIMYSSTSDLVKELKTVVSAYGLNVATGVIPGDFREIERVDISVNANATVNGDARLIFTTSTEPTVWTPYSNICPITGWTGANVTRMGKNLWNEDYTEIYDSLTPVYRPVYVGDGRFTLSTTAPLNSSNTANLFLLPGNVESGISSNINGVSKNVSRTAISMGGYVTVAYRGYQGVNPADYHTQLESGREATEYEPYQGDTYSVDWKTEAGTVYGGTLDVVSGELTVDRANVDLGTLVWNYITTSGRDFFTVNKADARTSGKIICSDYKTIPGTSDANMAIAEDKTINLGGKYLKIKDTAYTDAASFKSAMSGVQLVYELAIPQVYHLTPQEVTTLLGLNNIFADTGDIIDAEYRADTKLYIDALINPDADMIAVDNIESDKYFTINNKLYISTAAITAGNPIVVGTNCEETDLATALNILKDG